MGFPGFNYSSIGVRRRILSGSLITGVSGPPVIGDIFGPFEEAAGLTESEIKSTNNVPRSRIVFFILISFCFIFCGGIITAMFL